MFRSMQKSGRRSRTGSLQHRRSRSFVASLEAVEDRTLMSALTSVSWNSGGVGHSEVFGLGFSNAVSMSKDGASFVTLGGNLKAISAGLDAAGNPEVYGIGTDNAVWADDNGAGFVSRGGAVLAISASADNKVFAIGTNNAAFVNAGGTAWTGLGGNLKAISAGLDAAGNPEVYGIGTDNAVWADDNGAGFVSRGGAVLAISASADNKVFAVGTNNAAFVNAGGTSWTGLGGNLKAISAGLDAFGRPEVYAIGTDAAAYVSVNGSGFGKIGGYVTELSGAAMGTVFARGGDVEQVFVSRSSSPFNDIGSIALADPASAAAYSRAPAGAALFNNGQPSYLDMGQGLVGDCWLDASLSEVAARDPQDIKNMFVYDGTTVDGGATVGLYSVRFFSPNGIGFYVQVDTALPSGGGYYNRVGNALGTQSLWTALAEKGCAEANALGLLTTGAAGQGSYAALNGGWPSWALQAITGKAAGDYNINSTNLVNDWNAGDLIVLTTNTPTSSYIVGKHAYAMVGYDGTSGQPFQMFSPWGTDSSGWAPGHSGHIYGLFNANATFITRNFSGQSLGAGAMPVDDVARAIEELTELAARGEHSESSGTIGSARRGPTGSIVGAEAFVAHTPGPRIAIG